ncbi:HD-GYP domain-containing protein [Paucibacter sp. KBW04]|uniref:HD-GYP domain-containing protein n=1 Tax=Paucibacter sp. KBW04 TaxID=2153361 RepID=UPI0018CC2A57|nr:HD-GYP domain-containing protein [Paucibacter sp. KBW04]
MNEPDVGATGNSPASAGARSEGHGVWRGGQGESGPAAAAQNGVSLREELGQACLIRDQALAAARQVLDGFRQGHVTELPLVRSVIDTMLGSVRRQPAALVNLARIKVAGDCAYAHAVSVGVLMLALACQLGLDDETCRDYGLAGMLQDLGMSQMPQALLQQPGVLSPAQFQHLRAHATLGHQMLLRSGMGEGPWLDAALQHHERCDGGGYPQGLQAEQIAPVARMGAICDVYDALTSERSHRPAWTPVQALAAMAAARGQFDRSILAAFIKLVGVYPVGTLVRLASQRLALVIESRPEAPRQPLLQPFFSLRTGSRLQAQALDTLLEPEADRILHVESPKTWGFSDLDDMWLARAA